jgi:hypothetical protein
MARLGSSGGALDDVVSPWTPSLVVEPQISAGEADERLARWLAVAEATYEL